MTRCTILGVFMLLASAPVLLTMPQVRAQQICRPALAFKDVNFSAMQPPTLERKWTAVVSVDAAQCAANPTGTFEIVFMRLQENAPDLEFKKQFVWRPPAVKVALDFAYDEAVQRYWISDIAPCVCRQ